MPEGFKKLSGFRRLPSEEAAAPIRRRRLIPDLPPDARRIEQALGVGALSGLIPTGATQVIGGVSAIGLVPFGVHRFLQAAEDKDLPGMAFGALQSAAPVGARLVRGIRALGGKVAPTRLQLPSQAGPAGAAGPEARAAVQEAADRAAGLKLAGAGMSPAAREAGINIRPTPAPTQGPLGDELTRILNEIRRPTGPRLVSKPEPIRGLPPTASAAESRARQAAQAQTTQAQIAQIAQIVQRRAPEGFTRARQSEAARELLSDPEVVAAGRALERRLQSGQPPKGVERRAVPEARIGAVPARTADRPPATSAPRPSARPRLDELVTPEDMARFGPPPQGVEPTDWFRISALEDRGRWLMKRGTPDARVVKELVKFWGRGETARRLGMGRSMVDDMVGVGRRPPRVKLAAEADLGYRRLLDDPRGFISTQGLITAGGAIAGGAIGAARQPEDDSLTPEFDRVANGIAGAIAGGAAGYAGARGVQALRNRGFSFNDIEALDSANLLAGPAAVKASLGSLGGVATGVYQRIREGRVREAQAIIRFMRKKGPQEWWRTLTEPTDKLIQRRVGPMPDQMAGRVGMVKPSTNPIAMQVFRPFIAADAAGVKALVQGGFSVDEAQRLMLVGEPTSWQGREILRVINSNVITRLGAKFPRTRIGSIERAVEFIPGAERLARAGGFNVRGARGVEQLSPRALRARQEIGGALGVAGGVYGYLRDPSFTEGGLVSSVVGPAFAPAAMGVAAGKALRRGKDPLVEALAELAFSTPQIGEADVRQLYNRFVPLRALRRALGGQ